MNDEEVWEWFCRKIPSSSLSLNENAWEVATRLQQQQSPDLRSTTKCSPDRLWPSSPVADQIIQRANQRQSDVVVWRRLLISAPACETAWKAVGPLLDKIGKK
jgi:hypothetical protein